MITVWFFGATQGAEGKNESYYATYPNGRTLLNELQQLGFGRTGVTQHQ